MVAVLGQTRPQHQGHHHLGGPCLALAVRAACFSGSHPQLTTSQKLQTPAAHLLMALEPRKVQPVPLGKAVQVVVLRLGWVAVTRELQTGRIGGAGPLLLPPHLLLQLEGLVAERVALEEGAHEWDGCHPMM
jgi:hypothetical protein